MTPMKRIDYNMTGAMSSSQAHLDVYHRVIIETDLEPDDFLTLAYLFLVDARVTSCTIVGFVVGEGDSRLKRVLLIHFLESLCSFTDALKPQCFPIVEGLDSTLVYPTTHLKPCWLEEASRLPKISDENKLKGYVNLYESVKPGLVLFLKPPREALLTSVDFSQAECRCYGGFNYRVLKTDLSRINALAARFRTFWHFSRKAELPASQDLIDTRTLQWLHDRKSLGDFIRRVTMNWNHHYIREITRTEEPVTDYKIVMADMLCLFPTVHCFERGFLIDYDQLDKAHGGPVYVTALDKSSRLEYVVAQFQGGSSSYRSHL